MIEKESFESGCIMAFCSVVTCMFMYSVDKSGSGYPYGAIPLGVGIGLYIVWFPLRDYFNKCSTY